MTLTFTDEDLFRWIDEWTLQKSEQCLGRVRNRQLREGLLTAEVQGSARHPYQVEIDLAASMRTARSRLQSACSCPVGRACKHVAAVLVSHMLEPLAMDESPLTEQDLAQPPRAELLAELSRWQSTRIRPAQPRRNGVIFELSTYNHRPAVLVRRVKYGADGAISPGKWMDITADLLLEPPAYLTPTDLAVMIQLRTQRQPATKDEWIDFAATLQLIVSSGHGWVSCGTQDVLARSGAPRRGELGWVVDMAQGATAGTHVERGGRRQRRGPGPECVLSGPGHRRGRSTAAGCQARRRRRVPEPAQFVTQ